MMNWLKRITGVAAAEESAKLWMQHANQLSASLVEQGRKFKSLEDRSLGVENHGSGAVVEVLVDAGPVPVLACKDKDSLLAIASEWRSAIGEVDRLASAIRTQYAGRWMPDEAYRTVCQLVKVAASARNAKSHARRMAMLKFVLPVTCAA